MCGLLVIFKLANFSTEPRRFSPRHLNSPSSSIFKYFISNVWLPEDKLILVSFSINTPFLYQFTSGSGSPIMLQYIRYGSPNDSLISSSFRFVSSISGIFGSWTSMYNVFVCENVSSLMVLARHSYVPVLLVLIPFQVIVLR